MRLRATTALLALFFVVRGVEEAGAQEIASENAARYALTIEVAWTASESGAEHPENPHWSRLIAVTHRGRYALFRDGDTASSGLALLATNGRVGVLEAELAEAQRRGRVGAWVVVAGIGDGVGTFELEIAAREDFGLLSFATMLAPSPDWFAGVAGLSLRDGDLWVETAAAPLFVWDAGADSGENATSRNLETQPRQSVRLLSHPAFLGEDGLRPIGRAVVRRLPPAD